MRALLSLLRRLRSDRREPNLRDRTATPRRHQPSVEELEPRVLLANHSFLVPLETATQAAVEVQTLERKAGYRNEVGVFAVEDAAGRVAGLLPGQRGYARAALRHARRLFDGRQAPESRAVMPFEPGTRVGFYMIQNSTRAAWLRRNPANTLGRGPLAFFSFSAANPGGFAHCRLRMQNGQLRFSWEDIAGGDNDYNDFVASIALVPAPVIAQPAALSARPSGRTPPTITVPPERITLREEQRFRTSAEKTISVPADASVLKFDLATVFDTLDPDSINDVFEAALLDDNGLSLVHTVNGDTDAFFNLTEGQSAGLGAGTTFDGRTVTVNLAGLPAGSAARAVLRLVNNDADTTTQAEIIDLRAESGGDGVQPSAVPEPSPLRATTAVDFAALTDVSAGFAAEYARTTFHDDSQELTAAFALRNRGLDAVSGPLAVAVTNLSDPTVRVRDADGFTPAGVPYYLLTGDIAPGAMSSSGSLTFYNPGRTPFTYNLVILGVPNRVPVFTSEPDTEALLGQQYRTDTDAVDPDGDTVTYALVSGPAGMSVDPATGVITWTPTEADLGSVAVTVSANDGRGGVARQAFAVLVDTNVPNRPPVITSMPVTDAALNAMYTYPVTARDEDNDSLAFSLTQAPSGMTIDPTSGVITWAPTAESQLVSDLAADWSDAANPNGPWSFNSAAGVPLTSKLTEYDPGRRLFTTAQPAFAVAPYTGSGNPGHIPVFLKAASPPKEPEADFAVGRVHLHGNDTSNSLPGHGNDVAGISWTAPESGEVTISGGLWQVYRSQGREVAWAIRVNGQVATGGLLRSSDSFNSATPMGYSRGSGGDAALTRVVSAGDVITLEITRGASAFATFVGVDLHYSLRTPPVAAGQSFPVTVAANDGRGGVGTQSFTMTVAPEPGNAPPVILSEPTTVALTGQTYRYAVDAFDPDGDTVTYSLAAGPAGANIDRNTGVLTFQPTSVGDYPFTVQAADGRGGVDVQTYTLKVLQGGTGEIRGTKFDDRDGDRTRDAGEPGLSGWTMYLDQNRNEQRDPDELTTTTGADGSYAFTNLPAGQYVVREEARPGWGQTSPGGSGSTQNTTGYYVNWTSANPAAGTASGVITLPGGSTITVGFQAVFANGAPGTFLDSQTNGGTNYWLPTAPYVSAQVTNPPPDTDILRLQGGQNQIYRVTFSEPIVDPIMSILSLGSGSIPTTYDFDSPFTIVSQGVGFFGGSATALSQLPGDVLRGVEGHGTLKFLGTFPTFSWTVPTPEFWHGFTFAVRTSESLQRDGFYVVDLSAGEIETGKDFGNRRVTDTPGNEPPVFTSTPPTAATAGRRLRYDAMVTDPDPFDQHTFDLVVKPQGMGVDPNRGIVVWTPSPDQLGEHDVILRVSDGNGGVALQQFRVTVSLPNTAPVITSTPGGPALLGRQFTYPVRAQDAENDPITFAVVSGPAGMAIDPNSGVLTWTPETLGDTVVTLAARDPSGAEDQQTFTLTVVDSNRSPVITSTPQTITGADMPYSHAVDALDPDGEPVTFSLVQAPDGVSIDPATGVLTWLPGMELAGRSFPLTVRAEDGRGGNDEQQFTLTVIDCTPGMREFDPVIEWHKGTFAVRPGSNQVMMTPAVIDLNDDNTPDVVFSTFGDQGIGLNSAPGVLRAVSGRDGSDLWTVTDPAFAVDAFAGVAVGDVDGDGSPEIFAVDPSQTRLRAFRSDGTGWWTSPPIPGGVGWGSAALADLDQDGTPEIVIGATVLNANGSIRWSGTGGQGNNGSGPLSVVADLDLDGSPEVVTGKTAYRANGTVYWTTNRGDGFAAIGNFDADPFPEIVVVTGQEAFREGRVYLLEHDGTRKWGPVSIPGGGSGGAPTVADFDNDGQPEIGVAGATRYAVFETDGSLKWQSTTQDGSSTATGSSVFDFDGDGSAEVVYTDELFLRIYRGADGQVLYQLPKPSGTTYEYPLIADVDGDGNAEIVAVANNYAFPGITGLVVIGDRNNTWVNARPIWNQHSYHITNVNDDGTIPAHEANSWEVYNTYRLNTLTQGFDPRATPDLVVASAGRVGEDAPLTFTARIENRGYATVNPGVSIAFYDGDPKRGGTRVGATETTLRLRGTEGTEGEEVTVVLDVPAVNDLWIVVDPDNVVPECDERNNALRAGIDTDAVNYPPRLTRPLLPSELVGMARTAYRLTLPVIDPDGDAVTFEVADGPDGLVVHPTSGVVAWLPDQAQVGTHEVMIRATDAVGNSTLVPFALIVSARGSSPIIVSTPRTSVGIGQPYLYLVQVLNPDGDPLTVTLDDAPAGMTLDPATLAITWTPTGSQLGSHTVRMRATDSQGDEAVQEFSVEVVSTAVNSAPQIVSTPPLAATAGRPLAYDPVAADPDHDPVFWSLVEAPAGMSIDPLFGFLRWTPGLDQSGPHTVSLTATDPFGETATQTFTIRVHGNNAAPWFTSTPPTRAGTDRLYSYTPHALDPDGDALTWSLTQSPAGMTIDPTTGRIDWTPTAGQLDSHDIIVRAIDGNGGTVTQTFTVVVSDRVSRPPIITSTPDTTAAVGFSYEYQIVATDPDGGSLTFALDTAPAGMFIDPVSGLIVWDPIAGQAGRHPVTVRVFDGDGGEAVQSFTLDVRASNQFPVLDGTPLQFVAAGETYRVVLPVRDPDGDPLTFTLVSGPAGMTLDTAGRMTWQTTLADVGIHDVEMLIADDRGAEVELAYQIRVATDTAAPRVAVQVSENPVDLGNAVIVQVYAVDDIGVSELTLTAGGVAVSLDAAGRATLRPTAAGPLELLATVRDATGNVTTATTTLFVRDPSDVNAPVATLTTPAGGTTITTFTDVVGTVTDENLAFYTLSVAPVGGAFTELARGTETVTDSALGRLDPTLLENGSYVLRLQAVDLGGNVTTTEREIELTGNLKLGNFRLTFTDLSVPVSGIPVVVARTYDTLTANQSGDLGYGWKLEVRDTDLRTSVPETGLEEDGIFNAFQDRTRVTVTLPDGTRQGFTFTPRLWFNFAGLRLYKPAFVPDPGVTSSLTVTQYDLLRLSDGSYTVGVPYNPADSTFGGAYTLTTREGLQYRINALTGDLQTVTDRNGNTVTFAASGVTSSTGVGVTFGRDPSGRITSVIDPLGNAVRYAYDARGDLTSVTDREGNGTRFTYRTDRPHYLDTILDPLGRTGARVEYDEAGRLQRVTGLSGASESFHDPARSLQIVSDAAGNLTTFRYDAQGNIVSETNGAGEETTRTYDAHGNLLTETDPLGQTRTYTYTPDGLMASQSDALGNTLRYTYGPFGLLASRTDALGHTTRYEHDARGNTVRETDALGHTTQYSHDPAGNLVTVSDALGRTTRYAYDAAGRLVQQTDALGQTVAYTHDAAGNRLSETTTVTTPTGPRAATVRQTYDANGRVITLTDPEGRTTTTEYDAAGNATATIDALGRRTEMTHSANTGSVEYQFADGGVAARVTDAAGRQMAVTDAGGRTVGYVHDGANRPTEMMLPDATPADPADNPRQRFEYDDAGRLIALTDEDGRRTTLEYDEGNRLVAVRDATGNATDSSHDAAGRKTSETDALGRVTRYQYDALGHLTRVLLPDGKSFHSAYDPVGNLASVTDTAGRTTGHEYDALNRLVAVIDAAGGRTEYGYDELGNRTLQRDALGRVTRFEYDLAGQRTAVVRPDGARAVVEHDAAGQVTRTVDYNGAELRYEYDLRGRLLAKRYPDGSGASFTYSPDGKRLTMTDERGVTRYEYDAQGRLSAVIDPAGRALGYAYDGSGRRTTLTAAGGSTGYAHDGNGRLAAVTGPGGDTTRYAYDAVGNLTRLESPDGSVETRTYDVLNRLVQLERTLGGVVQARYAYTLDSLGNRIRVDELGGRRVDYTYDSLNRLTSEAILDPIAGNRSTQYTYDATGNRLTRTDSDGGTTAYTYDELDRLVSEVTAGVETLYSYDANGNVLSRTTGTDTASYSWDVENRLTSAEVTDAGTTRQIAYQYDADGNRVARSTDDHTTEYLVDAALAFPRVVEEYGPGGLEAGYVYGVSLVSQSRGGETRYHHADGPGNVRQLTSATGVVTDDYTFDAFGNRLQATGTTESPYGYRAEPFDGDLGLQYLRARYYDPATGRFLSVDPFEGRPQDPVSLHDYQYASGNPVTNADPSGRFSMSEQAVAVAVGAIVGGIALTSGTQAVAANLYVHSADGSAALSWEGRLSSVKLTVSVPLGLHLFAADSAPVRRNGQLQRYAGEVWAMLGAGLEISAGLAPKVNGSVTIQEIVNAAAAGRADFSSLGGRLTVDRFSISTGTLAAISPFFQVGPLSFMGGFTMLGGSVPGILAAPLAAALGVSHLPLSNYEGTGLLAGLGQGFSADPTVGIADLSGEINAGVSVPLFFGTWEPGDDGKR